LCTRAADRFVVFMTVVVVVAGTVVVLPIADVELFFTWVLFATASPVEDTVAESPPVRRGTR
jgi:hypothetical protein